MEPKVVQSTHEQIINGPFTRLWHKYVNFIENATRGSAQIGRQEITYWRDRLFTSFITYLMPVCLIALVPGVFMGIKSGYVFIAVFDLLVALSIAIITLNKKFNLVFRKIFVVFALYCLAIVLLVFLGLLGPGLIYLLALSVLITLFFNHHFAYWSVVINFIICVGCAFIIDLKLFGSPLISAYGLGSWIACSSNLVFLSWICIVLIGNTIKSLENTYNKEFQLKNKLQQEVVQRIEHIERLKESEAHYRSLFSLSPSPMWVLDSESLQFLQVNESAVKSYGYSNDEFLAMSAKDIKSEKDMPGFLETLHENHKTGTPFIRINQHRRQNGELFYVEVRFNSIPFRGKQGILVMVRDMTEQMNFTEAIEGQNAKLREIAYIQSHVVRAPLARIMGLINIINKNSHEKPDSEVLLYLDQSAKEFDDIIKMITRNTDQADHL